MTWAPRIVLKCLSFTLLCSFECVASTYCRAWRRNNNYQINMIRYMMFLIYIITVIAVFLGSYVRSFCENASTYYLIRLVVIGIQWPNITSMNVNYIPCSIPPTPSPCTLFDNLCVLPLLNVIINVSCLSVCFSYTWTCMAFQLLFLGICVLH